TLFKRIPTIKEEKILSAKRLTTLYKDKSGTDIISNQERYRRSRSKFELSSPSRFCSYSISFERDPIFIAGRYCKYSRTLPQSPWSSEDKAAPKLPGHSVCISENFVLQYEFTFKVSEKVCEPLKKRFAASDARFVASGREDLDVRMLGRGRPFTVELRNCHLTSSLSGTDYVGTLQNVEIEINNMHPDIEVKYLTRISREEAELISLGEEGKIKY
ncbi:unnamed protein product, partial [Strongylus vulgaris]